MGREARLDLPRPHLWRETVPLRAGYAAEEENLDLFLFGHTHQPLVDMRGKTLFLNPGSIGDHFRPFYGIITLQNSHLDGHTVPLV